MDANCPPEPPALQRLKNTRQPTATAMGAAWRCNGIQYDVIYHPDTNIMTLHHRVTNAAGYVTMLGRYMVPTIDQAINLTDAFLRHGQKPNHLPLHSFDCFRDDGTGKSGMRIMPLPAQRSFASNLPRPNVPFYTVTLSSPTDEGRAVHLGGLEQAIEMIEKNGHLCPP